MELICKVASPFPLVVVQERPQTSSTTNYNGKEMSISNRNEFSEHAFYFFDLRKILLSNTEQKEDYKMKES